MFWRFSFWAEDLAVLDRFEAPLVEWREEGEGYQIEGLVEDRADLELRLEILGLEATFEKLEEKNWLEENMKSFIPVEVGSFYIHGSNQMPKGKIPLMIDASGAFGSGHHESTCGCLMAIDKFACRRALDLGTGSGILAMAIAKRHGAEVVACDNDPDSVRIAKENMAANGVQALVLYSDGFSQIKGTFDLIVANILARPLCRMAEGFAGHLEKEGRVILSGLLVEQKESVKERFEEAGLHCIEELDLGQWSTLILRR